jgi:hypothetical protein
LVQEKDKQGKFLTLKIRNSRFHGSLRIEQDCRNRGTQGKFIFAADNTRQPEQNQIIEQGITDCLYESGGTASFILKPFNNGRPMIVLLKQGIYKGSRRWMGSVGVTG